MNFSAASSSSPPSTVEELTEETRVSLPDEDAGPTKAWLVGFATPPMSGPTNDSPTKQKARK